MTRGHGICQMLSWQPSSDEISCCSLSLSRQVLLFLPHLLSWGYSTAPCTLHLACSLAGGGGNVGSTVAMPAALVVFNPGVGGVARAPLVPPTGPAEGWHTAATYTQRQSHHADNLSSEHRPDENAFLARVWAVAASSRDIRLHVPACRECRGGSGERHWQGGPVPPISKRRSTHQILPNFRK